MANEIQKIKEFDNENVTSNIGFPQFSPKKLFKGEVIKLIDNNTQYDGTKIYIYKDNTSYIPIENEYHFECIKNGYVSLEPGAEYYTKLDDEHYSYHQYISHNDIWEDKLKLSNEIKNIDLFLITPANERIYIESENYFYNKASNKNYEKTEQKNYTTYEKINVDWNKEYELGPTHIGGPIIGKLKNTNTFAETGRYISILKKNEIYILGLLDLEFDENGICKTNNININASYYKLPSNFDSNSIYFISTESKINKVELNNNNNNFDYNNKVVYNKLNSDWQYPNTSEPGESIALLSNNETFYYKNGFTTNFPIYTPITKSKIEKTININSYPVYEKIAEIANYEYCDNKELQLIFTRYNILYP